MINGLAVAFPNTATSDDFLTLTTTVYGLDTVILVDDLQFQFVLETLFFSYKNVSDFFEERGVPFEALESLQDAKLDIPKVDRHALIVRVILK